MCLHMVCKHVKSLAHLLLFVCPSYISRQDQSSLPDVAVIHSCTSYTQDASLAAVHGTLAPAGAAAAAAAKLALSASLVLLLSEWHFPSQPQRPEFVPKCRHRLWLGAYHVYLDAVMRNR